MRYRFLPYTLTFACFFLIFFFPLLEFDLNWRYSDWDTRISNTSGSDIMKITKNFTFDRYPGIQPGWGKVHSRIEEMLLSISNSKLPEYSLYWKYQPVVGLNSVPKHFYVNNKVGGYIVTLLPKYMNYSSEFKSICFFTNLDSIAGSPGFTSNALGMAQSLLALEELSKTPGLKNPISVIIADTNEIGSNTFMNMVKLPELQKCFIAVSLDSFGMAQTVPNLDQIIDLNRKTRKLLPIASYNYRVSNWIIDTVDTLKPLKSNEILLIRREMKNTALIELIYSDNHFYYHTPKDTITSVNAAAVKARYDKIIEIGKILGMADSDNFGAKTRFLDYSSYVSILGVTIRVSSDVQLILISIGILLSVYFIYYGYFKDRESVIIGCTKTAVVVIIQFFVLALVIGIFLIIFSLDSLIIHKGNSYVYALILVMLISSMIMFSLQLNFYTSYFTRDHAGGMISMFSIIYGGIALFLLIFNIHFSVHFAIPCFLFGFTNICLFLRHCHLADKVKWKKVTYAISLFLSGLLSFLTNIGSACATLHIVFGLMSTQDLTVNIIVISSFWCALFPFLFSIHGIIVIYMNDESVRERSSSIRSLSKMEENVVGEPLIDEAYKFDKIVLRRFIRFTSIIIWIFTLIVIVACSFLPPWNSEQPVRISTGITFSQNIHDFVDSSNQTLEGYIHLSSSKRVLKLVSKRLSKVSFPDNYTVNTIQQDSCYLANHVEGPCLQVGLSQNGEPKRYFINHNQFNGSQLMEYQSNHNEPLNYTRYWKSYQLHIPHLHNVSVFGYPVIRLRIYSSNIEGEDSKIYANVLDVKVHYNKETKVLRSFVVEGDIVSDGKDDMDVFIEVCSKVDSQVLIRVTDIACYKPQEFSVLQDVLGDGVVATGNIDCSLSRSVNYFIHY